MIAAHRPGTIRGRCSTPCRTPDIPVCSPPSRYEAPFRLNELIERIPVGLGKVGKGRLRTRHFALSAKQGEDRVLSSKPVGITTRRVLLRFHLMLQNFRVIMKYNPAEAYALAIGHLVDRLRGGEPFAQP